MPASLATATSGKSQERSKRARSEHRDRENGECPLRSCMPDECVHLLLAIRASWRCMIWYTV